MTRLVPAFQDGWRRDDLMVMDRDDLPTAGWYGDPYDSRRLRWWNGRTWTEHTASPASQGTSVPVGPRRRWFVPRGLREWAAVLFAVICLGTCTAALPYMDLPPGDW